MSVSYVTDELLLTHGGYLRNLANQLIYLDGWISIGIAFLIVLELFNGIQGELLYYLYIVKMMEPTMSNFYILSSIGKSSTPKLFNSALSSSASVKYI